MDDSRGGRTSVVVGSAWMVVISLALFMVPLVNGIVGGAVGGYKVGTVKRALVAAILPAVVVATGLWGLFAFFDAPVLGFFAGTASAVFIALADVGLFIGAAAGAAVANAQLHHQHV